jgi:hypothetical protein
MKDMWYVKGTDTDTDGDFNPFRSLIQSIKNSSDCCISLDFYMNVGIYIQFTLKFVLFGYGINIFNKRIDLYKFIGLCKHLAEVNPNFCSNNSKACMYSPQLISGKSKTGVQIFPDFRVDPTACINEPRLYEENDSEHKVIEKSGPTECQKKYWNNTLSAPFLFALEGWNSNSFNTADICGRFDSKDEKLELIQVKDKSSSEKKVTIENLAVYNKSHIVCNWLIYDYKNVKQSVEITVNGTGVDKYKNQQLEFKTTKEFSFEIKPSTK